MFLNYVHFVYHNSKMAISSVRYRFFTMGLLFFSKFSAQETAVVPLLNAARKKHLLARKILLIFVGNLIDK